MRTDELCDRPPESCSLGRFRRLMRAFVPPGRAYLLSPFDANETSFATDPPGAPVPAGFEGSGEVPE